MATQYAKTKANVTLSKLQNEINVNGTITQVCEYINWKSPDTLDIFMAAALSAPEETELDTVITDHIKENLPSIALGVGSFHFVDDFVGEVVSADWNQLVSGTGSVIAKTTGDEDHGVVKLKSGGNVNRLAHLNWGGGRAINTSHYPRAKIRIKCVDLADSYTRVGFYRDDNDYLFFEKTGTGNWMAISKSGGTATTSNDTSIASSSNWVELVIVVENLNIVKFYVNRILQITHTTDIPTNNLEFSIYQLTTGGAAVRELNVDFVELWQER